MNTRVLVVNSENTGGERRRLPQINLCGSWLGEVGFDTGTLVSVTYEHGRIVLTAQGKGLENYKRLVKGARKMNNALFEVRNKFQHGKPKPFINLEGYWLENIGFTAGSVIAVFLKPDIITIRLVDLEKLNE